MVRPVTPEHGGLIKLIESERPAELRTTRVTGEVQLLERAPTSDQPARDGDWFVEPHGRAPHMVIIGAIHIAIPLHRMAKLMGYRVTVADARAKFATAERFPEADEILVSWPDEALAGITLDRSTYVVILTHDPKFDLPALRSVVGKDVRYIGAIGSRKTNQNRFDELRLAGFTADQLAAVHAPIGRALAGPGP